MANALLSVNLRYLRETRTEFKQKDFAKEVGLGGTTYANYETGHSEPSFLVLKKIIEYYDISADDVLYKDLSKAGSIPKIETKEGGVVSEDIGAAIKMYRANLKQDIEFRQLTTLQLDKLERMILRVTDLVEKASRGQSSVRSKGNVSSGDEREDPKPHKQKQSK